MTPYITKLLREFVSCPSYVDLDSGITESKFADLLSLHLSRILPHHNQGKIYIDKNRYNLLVLPKEPQVLFCCHLDTVPPVHLPLTTKVTGDAFFGLGSKDMKGGIVSALVARAQLSKQDKEKVGFLFYCDEEGTQRGIEAMLDVTLPKSIQYFFCPESRFNLGVGCRGYMILELECTGISAHTARPEQGINAIEKAYTIARNFTLFIKKLSRHNSCTIVNISGGGSANKVPSMCALTLSCRIISPLSRKAIQTKVKELAKTSGLKKLVIKKMLIRPPSIEAPESLVRTFKKAALAAGFHIQNADPKRGGYNDIALLSAKHGIPFLNFGPFGEGNHGPNEYVSLQSIADTAQVLEKVLCDNI